MFERIPPENCKGVWEFKAAYGDDYFVLNADEDSSKKELLAEYAYWEDQLTSYDPPIEHQKALWKMLAWLEMLAERAL